MLARVCRLAITGAALSFFVLGLGSPQQSSAQALTDQQLLDAAVSSYSASNWVEAAPYLFAYIQRSPSAMASDPQHAKSVRDAYNLAISSQRQDEQKCASERQQWVVLEAQANNGVSHTSSEIRIPPPPIALPSGAATGVDWGMLAGRYQMTHDGWRGTLSLSPQGSSYTASDGKSFSVLTEGSGYHVIFYVVGLGGQNEAGKGGQKFDGYAMTQTHDAIAGVTWWDGRPFGFFATKLPAIGPRKMQARAPMSK